MASLLLIYYAVWMVLTQKCQCLTEDELINLSEYRINRMIRDSSVVMWTSLFLILSIYNFHCKVHEIKLKIKSIQYLSILVIFFMFIAFICRGIELFFTNEFLLNIGFYLFAQFGMITLYILVLLRLYHTFKDTQYKLSTLTLIVHPIILIISNLLTFASSTFDYFDIYPHNFIFISMASIIYISGLSHLSYHFGNSLFLCILSIDEKKSQNKFLKTIVKQTILANWINFAGFTFAATNIASLLIDLNRKLVILVLIRHQIMAISIFVIILCVYLSFDFYGVIIFNFV